jgi:hypothetical protein
MLLYGFVFWGTIGPIVNQNISRFIDGTYPKCPISKQKMEEKLRKIVDVNKNK